VCVFIFIFSFCLIVTSLYCRMRNDNLKLSVSFLMTRSTPTHFSFSIQRLAALHSNDHKKAGKYRSTKHPHALTMSITDWVAFRIRIRRRACTASENRACASLIYFPLYLFISLNVTQRANTSNSTLFIARGPSVIHSWPKRGKDAPRAAGTKVYSRAL
jgi:hypothetical protein